MSKRFASLIIVIDSFKYIVSLLMLKAATSVGTSTTIDDLDLVPTIS
jgi:hypothetical protein